MALSLNPIAQNSSKLATVPSPLGGLNAFDNLASMPPTDAIKLNNWVPQPYGCTVRKGYQIHATGLGGPVDTVGGWSSKTGAQKLFAFANKKMFDITAPGAVGAPLLQFLTNDFWQSVEFANAAGSHTIFCNGADNPIWYSGAGLQRLISGNGTDNGTISGVNPATFIQVTSHQRRLWFVPINETRAWFLAPDAVFGVAQYYDFGPFFRRGGYLSSLSTWTVDAGQGSNDKLVAVSSNGEAVVFQGTDPATAATWSLVGVYFIGSPIRGRRYFTDIVGDLLYLTDTGIVSMSTVLVSTQINASNASVYSKKIEFLLSDLTTDLSDTEGWELKFFPSINLLFINIPTINFGAAGQLVNNTITNAWCTFSELNARTWYKVDGMPYFGDPNGRVLRGWILDRDNIGLDGLGGTNINSSCQQAYSNFGSPTAQKQIGIYRPVFINVRKIGYNSKITYDYLTPTLNLPSGSSAKSAVAVWGEALWGTDRWSGGVITQREWRSAEGIGTAVSLIMNATSEAETTWVSTDYTYKTGGPL